MNPTKLIRKLFVVARYVYIPEDWSLVRIVFVGKDNYDKAKLCKTISLMFFLLKTLDRLIDQVLERLQCLHFRKMQQAYLTGRSVETVPHQKRSERGGVGGQVAPGVGLRGAKT